MLKNSQCDSLSLKLFMNLFKKYYYTNINKLSTLFDNFLIILKNSKRNKCSIEVLIADFNLFIKQY